MGSKVKFTSLSVYASFVQDKMAKLANNPSPTTVKDISTQIRNASSALLNLHPISLYYFIGAKAGGTIHYELIYLKDKEYIDALVKANLATLQVVQGSPNDPNDPFHGEKGLQILLTDSGKELLRGLGVKIEESATQDSHAMSSP